MKILIFDIETAPIKAYVWGLWDQNVALNQIHTDWFILSWSAKWYKDSPKNILYRDQRNAKNVENDKKTLLAIWKLLDEADVVITQNGKKFDQKKLNARFILNGMKPPSPYQHVDTLQIAKKHFAFTSNKLEYMTDKLCTKYKKITNKGRKFFGFALWDECLKGNLVAWREMEKYNKYDVLSLEELYTKLQVWDTSINFSIYDDGLRPMCNCGSFQLEKRGFFITSRGKYQRYQCKKCAKWHSSTKSIKRIDVKAI